VDIGSKSGYPSSALSNFAPHKFIFDGVECNSMEGLLQSFKSKNHDVQIERCKLVGYAAKKAGRNINWQTKQLLYWKNRAYPRNSLFYQNLLDRAYDALAENEGFRKALLATGKATLTHSIGRTSINETVLTRSEFCSRLTEIRNRLQKES
jgi:hypothetical protein